MFLAPSTPPDLLANLRCRNVFDSAVRTRSPGVHFILADQEEPFAVLLRSPGSWVVSPWNVWKADGKFRENCLLNVVKQSLIGATDWVHRKAMRTAPCPCPGVPA